MKSEVRFGFQGLCFTGDPEEMVVTWELAVQGSHGCERVILDAGGKACALNLKLLQLQAQRGPDFPIA